LDVFRPTATIILVLVCHKFIRPNAKRCDAETRGYRLERYCNPWTRRPSPKPHRATRANRYKALKIAMPAALMVFVR
ncbi:hypothetical protein N8Z55_04625, partial [Pseudomonadales bacterium]|nr:hypothetical protein [Pseudomonadales bacterium]